MAQQERKKRKQKAEQRKRLPILVGIGAVVIVAGVIAIGASGGGDNKSTATTTTVPGGVAPAEYQPVKVTGDALDPLGDSGTDAALQKDAPTLEGYDFKGAPVTIDPGSDGLPTMLVFLAHWCPHCNREVPRLLDWLDEGLVPTNLRVVGVATSSKNDQANWPPSEWLKDFKWPWEVFTDSDQSAAASAYGVDGFPFMVIVDGDGKVVSRHSGEIEVADLTTMVNTALGIE